jgi:FkbM family methyltransferase
LRASIISATRPLYFRGKARLLSKLCPQQGELTAKIFNYNVSLDLAEFGQRAIFMGVFEPRETRVVKNYLQEGMTVVDAGANVGYYTLLAASKVGSRGRVIAFEPSPYAFERMTHTVESNQITQVTTVPLALSDQPGEATLYVPIDRRHHSPTMNACDGVYPIPIRAQTLDQYLTDNGVERVDMLKLDVEGFEPNVIKGAINSIKKGRVRAVLCELNEVWLNANGWSERGMLDFMVSLGFKAEKFVVYGPGLTNIFFTYSR